MLARKAAFRILARCLGTGDLISIGFANTYGGVTREFRAKLLRIATAIAVCLICAACITVAIVVAVVLRFLNVALRALQCLAMGLHHATLIPFAHGTFTERD